MNSGRDQLNRIVRRRGFCAAALLAVWLLLNSLLTAAAAGNGGPVSAGILSEASSSPRGIRSEAERAGHLAVMRTGGGAGLQVGGRNSRPGLSPVQKLQSDAARPEPPHLREPAPNCPFRIESSGQSCLFQLFPRSYLPVRAGPFSLC